MSATKTTPVPNDWIRGSQVTKRTGWSRVKLYRLAAGGHIRTQITPGLPVKYSAEDVDLCSQHQASGSKGARR
jgi:hypothetical protein